MYSSAFGNQGQSNYTQVIEWSYFVGSGTFCYKVSAGWTSTAETRTLLIRSTSSGLRSRWPERTYTVSWR